jgi:hypothetical protein
MSSTTQKMQKNEINTFVKSQNRINGLSNFFKMEIKNLIDQEKRKEYYSEGEIDTVTQCYQRCFPEQKKSIIFKGEHKMSAKDIKSLEERLKRVKKKKYKGSFIDPETGKEIDGDNVLVKFGDIEFPGKIRSVIHYAKRVDFIFEIDKRLDSPTHLKYLYPKLTWNRHSLIQEDQIIRKISKQEEINSIVEKLKEMAIFRKKAISNNFDIGQGVCIPLNRSFDCGVIESFTLDNRIKVHFYNFYFSKIKKVVKYTIEELINAKEETKHQPGVEKALKNVQKEVAKMAARASSAMGGYIKNKRKTKKKNLKHTRKKKSYKVRKYKKSKKNRKKKVFKSK